MWSEIPFGHPSKNPSRVTDSAPVMDVQFAGAQGRRRRRLAVAEEPGASIDEAPDGALPDAEPGIGMGGAAPWVPRQPWKMWVIGSLLSAMMIGSVVLSLRPVEVHPHFSSVVNHYLSPDSPLLVQYFGSSSWAAAAILSWVIGWHRSRSRLDFRGRYRVWPWLSAFCALWSFSNSTNFHHVSSVAVARVAAANGWENGHWPLIAWLIPALCGALPMWFLIDRDMRRSLPSVILLRISLTLLLAAGLCRMFPDLIPASAAQYPVTTILNLFGGASLAWSLWMHTWHVSYVTHDPPPAPVGDWSWLRVFLWPVTQLRRFLTRKAAVVTEPTTKRGRKKKTEEKTEEAEKTTTTRSRRSTTKRASKPRTRVKAEAVESEDEPADEEETTSSSTAHGSDAGDESYESTSTHGDEDTGDEDGNHSVGWDDWEKESSRTSSHASSRGSSQPAQAKQTAKNDDDSDDDDDDDGDSSMQYRVDGGSDGADPFKGLSKRQRRELRKQLKDQQRGSRR